MTTDESDEENFQEELSDARRQVREHPGYVEHVLLSAFGRTIEAVFRPNWRGLLDLLRRPDQDFAFAVGLVQNMLPRSAGADQFDSEVTQFLHNYVAGAMTLVDHSRRIMGDRVDDLAKEFMAKKKDLLARNPEVVFIQNLRNYTLHRSLPALRYVQTMTNINTPRQQIHTKVCLDSRQLLVWDGWNPRSRRFLAESGQTVDLRSIIHRHGLLVLNLNVWLHNSLVEQNKAALADANKLVTAANAVLFGVSVEEAEEFMRRHPW